MSDTQPQRRAGDNQWHLDKRVPIAFILTMMLQTAAIVWWASGLDAQQAALFNRVEKLETRNDKITDQLRDIEGRLARVEAIGEAQLKSLERIHGSLERMNEKYR